ncbi:hypothetical protein EMIT0324P_40131 [Pseudomonas chlororaphis]
MEPYHSLRQRLQIPRKPYLAPAPGAKTSGIIPRQVYAIIPPFSCFSPLAGSTLIPGARRLHADLRG